MSNEVEPRVEMPNAYWRWLDPWKPFLDVTALVCVLAVIVWIATGLRWPVLVLLNSLGFAVVFGIPRMLKRRFAKHLLAQDLMVCLECGYSLRGLDANRCPECGVEFRLEEVQSVWSRWLQRKGA